jgi:hypothetical protein
MLFLSRLSIARCHAPRGNRVTAIAQAIMDALSVLSPDQASTTDITVGCLTIIQTSRKVVRVAL